MTEIYTVVHNNRRRDVEIFPFINRFKAITLAVDIAMYNKDEEFQLDELYMLPDKWLYYVRYSEEGDCVYVEATELDETS